MREFFLAGRSVYVKDEAECRKFIEAVIWINRTGARWRDLRSLASLTACSSDACAGSEVESGSGCMRCS
jgi:hypothetical protein